jgi:hypothetical protein
VKVASPRKVALFNQGQKWAVSPGHGNFVDFLAFAAPSLSTTQRKDNKQGARKDPEQHLSSEADFSESVPGAFMLMTFLRRTSWGQALPRIFFRALQIRAYRDCIW